MLFGNPLDPDRYLKVVTLCSLRDHTLHISETGAYHAVSLARALYSPAQVLLLDEPLAGLDPHQREQFFFESVVLWAGEEGRTVVMTTSNPDLIPHAHQVSLGFQ